jgi:sugar lactone lactonase YvrE
MIKTIQAERLFQTQSTLGEGPLWQPQEQRLYWVDIQAQKLFIANRDLTGYEFNHFTTPVGCFGFREAGGLVLGTGQGFAIWDHKEAAPELLWNPLPKREGVRLNDGKVDPAGRFWAGSMDIRAREGELYRLDPDGSRHTLLKNIGISNGIDWSPDRTTMYHTDSIQYTIYAYDYALETGEIENKRPFIQLPKDCNEVVPDGLCVDEEGCIWSAHWNGWGVVRYKPDGKPILKIEVPVQRVTSCCFGGEKLDQVFITTAREGLTDDALREQPEAGNLFVIQTNTTGQATNLFGS